MAAQVGRTASLTWGDSPNTLAGVREKGVSFNGEPIDITSDDDGGWRTLLDTPGENSVEISVSGIVKSGVMKELCFSGERMHNATLTYDDGGVVTGSFYLSGYSETANYKDAIQFEGTLMSSGEVAYTPGSP